MWIGGVLLILARFKGKDVPRRTIMLAGVVRTLPIVEQRSLLKGRQLRCLGRQLFTWCGPLAPERIDAAV